MNAVFESIWHGWLNRPYQLAKVVDSGSGQTVVLLHGIGKSAGVWQHLTGPLTQSGHRAVSFDLLGFGKSPKPDVAYTIDDHAKAVIASITALHVKQPVVIVGHSMGCLVAVRVARLRADLVRHLVLYEMPLYEGLPEKWRYRLRTDLYQRFYTRIIKYQPTFNEETAKMAERFARKVVGFEVTEETWQPFIRSLQNTILKQTAPDDIKQLRMPMDVIYGSYDMFVIRGRKEQVFGSDSSLITAHTIRERHAISPKASQFIMRRIAALE
jgi:pimeloyl-ACP methyl ester carboxylesterase